ncbi:DUF4229 domain-containing protein [Demequina mangrovi]|uniref:DUF4229 domain-containing protein n=1 Tax=Demequina mangrovi TaxID=1043493 RepID=A0A1H6W950_9MICO|nr:DUF4229 domain-containing protein [Demequina mangrovi]SEJ13518.1 Protein of unknown function [Demequina mangrovi]
MHVVAYWGARTGIFLAVLGVLWAFNWRDVIAFLAAFVVAWLVSYLVLPGMRAKAQAQMDGWISRSEKGLRDADAEEDAEIDGSPRPHGSR